MKASKQQSTLKTIRDEFPYEVRKLTQISIPVDDNVKLAATIWMPANSSSNENELKSEEKFASILEYLPYRKSDWTSARDEIRLKYFAGYGYAAIRVDIRGTGNSQGLFDDEYSQQEMNDGLKILGWIENQTWSNGKIVLFGKSWGGFNGLQIGFLQPKLSGIISAYSTDNRYSDDVHYYGGCLAAQEALSWSTQMLIWLSLPPHSTYQGGIDKDENLFDIWKQRLNNLVPLDSYWIKHQHRDDYWRHGSVCEDYSKISCPVLLIGGFADLYTDPVFRLIDQLKCNRRAIIGPWGHQWPDDAYPGPQIGFLQEVVQWLDYHIKGIKNDYETKGIVSVYQLSPNVNEIHSILNERQGQWISLKPNFETKEMLYYLSFNSLTIEPNLNESCPKQISFRSPIETGIASGNLLGWGTLVSPDHPLDQREDDGRSITFYSNSLDRNYELFGFPKLKLKISSNKPVGLLCARLSMIDEKTSCSILLSRTVLNLTHRTSHEHPQLLNIDEFYEIEMKLSAVCVYLPMGSRLCLALSTSYWPIVWPSAELSTLTIDFTDPNSCVLTLPYLNFTDYSKENEFLPSETAEPIQLKTLRNASCERLRIFDEINEKITLKINEDCGSIQYVDGLIFDEKSSSNYEIKRHDPNSANILIERDIKYYFQDKNAFQIDTKTKSIMFYDQTSSTFRIEHQLNVKNQNEEVFNKIWNLSFPRNF